MKTLKKLNLFLVFICILVFTLSTTVTGRIYREVLFDNTYRTVLGSIRQMEYNLTEKSRYYSEAVTKLLSGQGLKLLGSEENVMSAQSYASVNSFNREVLETLHYTEDIASVLYVNQDGIMIGTDGKTVWKEEAGSGLTEKLMKAPKEFSFQGGFHSALFYGNKQYLKKPLEDYITLLGLCRFSQQPHREGFLLVNIKESAFRSVFSATMEDNTGDIYILDGEGNILSSTRPELIGEGYPLFSSMDSEKAEQYFTDDDLYGVSYHMNARNWWIVWEKPVKSFYKQADQLYMILLVFVLCSLFIILISYGIYTKILLRPLNILINAMGRIGKGQYGIRIEEKTDGEIGRVIESFNTMSCDIETLTRENARITNEKRALQMLALQEQMSPHFVLNALNTIKWMAMINREENIVNMVIALSRIIHAFKNTNAFGTIGEEIAFIKSYIIVMNYRYGDVLKVHYDIQKCLENKAIPIFFIQPLVENALKHGFASTNCKGDIFIRADENGGTIEIQVSDNGSGMQQEKIRSLNQKLRFTNQMPLSDSGGVGLMNIAKRIQIYYGEPYGIRVEKNADNGLCVRLILPGERRKETNETGTGI